jgi:hypothetical protein
MGQTAANGAALELRSAQVDSVIEVLDRAADEATIDWQRRLFDRLRSEVFRGFGFESLTKPVAS